MDNATFDRLARLLGSGASRRHTLRALIAAALTGATAEELLAAKKDKGRGKDKKKDGGKDRNDRANNGDGNGDGKSERVAAQGKKNKTKAKAKKKRKRKNKPNNNTGGNNCAGTPLRPGQTFLGCDFSGDNLRGKDLNSSLFKDVDLTDADLCGANLESTSFVDSDLGDANLTNVNLDSSSHSKTSFAGANLAGASLRVATFSKVDFTGANFTGADLTGATFADTDFAGAIFCRTIQPNGDVDDNDCDICDNRCGLCEDCDGEDCTPPECCENPSGPGGFCVDTDSDPLNCGGCDFACFDNLANACVDGDCVCGSEPECSGGETCCRGRGGDPTSCVDTDSDPLFCGNCDTACQIPLNPCLSIQCVDGDCVEVDAADGTDCELEGESGVCCAAGSSVTCVVGTECCGNAQCDAGKACCEGQCIDVQDDPTNCGGCEVICVVPLNPCLTNECIEGACVQGTLSDGTECEAFDNDGICCAASGTSTCVIGAECCTGAQCGPGESCCDSECLNTQTDFNRCGSCNNQCPESKADACVGGECVCGNSGSACGLSLTCCEGECTNTDEDVDNCGACGEACEVPLNPCLAVVCQNGLCQEIANEDGSACAVGLDEGICCTSGGESTCIVGAECCSNSECTAAEACCENQCIDVQDNFDNCGACDVSCADSVDQCFHRACVQGECATLPDEDGEPCFLGEEGICCASGETAICIGGGQCCTDAECVEGENCCDNTCIPTSSDFDHCGGCDACLANADACVNSVCVCGELGFACPEGNLCCEGSCVDPGSDPENCGGCGNECEINDTCDAGMCTPCAGKVCDDICIVGGECCGIGDCPEQACMTPVDCDNGQCVYQNIANGTECLGGSGVCTDGVCACGSILCQGGLTCCDGQCIDTGDDLENCGACGLICQPSGSPCVEAECNGGNCELVEADPGAICQDGLEPGLCCPAAESVICIEGAICCDNTQCANNPDGAACCANQCVETSSDFDHCGSCEACDSDAADACVEGTCVCGAGAACESGEKCCGGQCIDTSSDRSNCGDCGVECVDGVCNAGSCVACDGIPCGSQCLEPPAECCTADECPGQECRVRAGCSEEHICQYAIAPEDTPCGFGVCDAEGNCILPD